MSEFIVIQGMVVLPTIKSTYSYCHKVGQCGNQIGNSFWPLVLYEHGVFKDNMKSSNKKKYDDALHSFFKITSNKDCCSTEDLKKCKIKARAILIDMERSVVERFHNAKLKDLFDRSCSLTDSPGSGNNWAFGHYEASRLHEDRIRELVRHAAEGCSALHGFLLFFSLSGGTGSGLGTAVLDYLSQDFPHVERIVVCVHPGLKERDVVTGPYNVAFSLSKLVEGATCVFPVDNKALEKICQQKKLTKDPLISDPFQHINGLIVRMLLNLTGGSRFPGSLNFDLGDLPTNLVPYKGMHFLASSISPISFGRESTINILKRKNDIFHAACNEDHHLIQLNSLSGRVHAAALLARGDIPFSALVGFQDKLMGKLKTSSMGVTLGLCSVPPHDFPLSLLLLSNSSSMGSLFSQTLADFNTLYSRKAYIHHYLNVDGFESVEFDLARECLLNQVDIYSRVYDDISVPRLTV